jgi:hypothetical protein
VDESTPKAVPVGETPTSGGSTSANVPLRNSSQALPVRVASHAHLPPQQTPRREHAFRHGANTPTQKPLAEQTSDVVQLLRSSHVDPTGRSV